MPIIHEVPSAAVSDQTVGEAVLTAVAVLSGVGVANSVIGNSVIGLPRGARITGNYLLW